MTTNDGTSRRAIAQAFGDRLTPPALSVRAEEVHQLFAEDRRRCDMCEACGCQVNPEEGETQEEQQEQQEEQPKQPAK